MFDAHAPGVTLDEATDEVPQSKHKKDDHIICAACGCAITRHRWQISMRGDHIHTVFNPAGHVFTILCYADAPGVVLRGLPSPVFTWFPGYQWRLAHCRGCGAHIGWGFSADLNPGLFFGLIKSALRDS